MEREFSTPISIYFAYLHGQEGSAATRWTICFVCKEYYDESTTHVVNKHSLMDMIACETSTCSDLFILRSEYGGVLRCDSAESLHSVILHNKVNIRWSFQRFIHKCPHECSQSHVYQSLSRSNGSWDKFVTKGNNSRRMCYLKEECKILIHG
jgi:hypothetical protein